MASLAAPLPGQDLARRQERDVAPAPKRDRSRRARKSIIPGFRLTMGFTIGWLSLIVLIPVSLIFVRSAGMGWDAFVEVAFSPRAVAAYRVSFGTALAAACINGVFGLLIAWVFTRYSFPGKRVFDALNGRGFRSTTAGEAALRLERRSFR